MGTVSILCENFFITLGVSLIYRYFVTTVIGGKNTSTFKVNLLIFLKVCVSLVYLKRLMGFLTVVCVVL